MQKKTQLRKEALVLRSNGTSIRDISSILKISSSTASIWCREVPLTIEQKEKLNLRSKNYSHLKGYSEQRHLDKVVRDGQTFERSSKEISILDKDNLFLVGVALYWGEGFKGISEQRIGFVNSDPRMIKLMMRWFRECLDVKESNFTLRTEFNSAHTEREEEIKEYWSTLTGVPTSQFNKSYIFKTKWLRDYSLKGVYYGVLRIRIRKSSELLVKLRGWIEGLSSNG